MARLVTSTKRLTPDHPDKELTKTEENVEFTWMNLYNPIKGYEPADIDRQRFIHGALDQGFVPFGVSCLITSEEATTMQLVTQPTDVFKPSHLHQLLSQADEVTRTGVWGMTSKQPVNRLNEWIELALEESPIYKALEVSDIKVGRAVETISYERSEEGNIVMLQNVVLVIDDEVYTNRFGPFGKITKAFNLLVRNR